MNIDITTPEQGVLEKEFPDCKYVEGRSSIIFAYNDEFKGDVYETANALQDAADFLEYVSHLNPAKYFNSRTAIGFNKEAKQANWSGRDGNRIHILWEEKYFTKDEFLHSCSHELVHPYYRLSPLHKSNQKWGEVFCEFLRGPVKTVMGQDGKLWWNENIKEHKDKGKNSHRNVAGQVLVYAKEKYYSNEEVVELFIDEFISDRSGIEQFFLYLFKEFRTRSFCDIFTPVEKMKI